MREIKFRAWNPKSRIMTEGLEISHLMKEEEFVLANKSESYIFEQYTGLKDKNGVEIYKGDLLNIGTDDFGFIVNNNGVTVSYEVKIDGCDYILYRADTNLNWGRLSRLSDMGWECKVVGSIHEKIEL